MKTKTKEFRAVSLTADAENKMTVEGYAAVFNQPALIWESPYSGYKYYEKVNQNAFTGADMSDVAFKYNHDDAALILARTRNKTLQLSVDNQGLKVRADIADTTTGRDVYTLIQRGDLDKMSFAFTVAADQVTNDDENKTSTREILKFDKIFDVSAVDFPAYDTTDISAVEARGADYFKALEQKLRDQELRKRLLLRTYF